MIIYVSVFFHRQLGTKLEFIEGKFFQYRSLISQLRGRWNTKRKERRTFDLLKRIDDTLEKFLISISNEAIGFFEPRLPALRVELDGRRWKMGTLSYLRKRTVRYWNCE